MIDYLVKLGADLNVTNNGGATPLHRAAHKHDYETAKLLMNSGADYNIRDRMGKSPYDLGDTVIKSMIQARMDEVMEQKQKKDFEIR